MIRLAGGKDALPLADPLEAGARHVPDRDVFRLRPQAERPSEVEEQDVAGVLVSPAALSSSGGEVECLDRDPGPTADVFDVDEHRLSTHSGFRESRQTASLSHAMPTALPSSGARRLGRELRPSARRALDVELAGEPGASESDVLHHAAHPVAGDGSQADDLGAHDEPPGTGCETAVGWREKRIPARSTVARVPLSSTTYGQDVRVADEAGRERRSRPTVDLVRRPDLLDVALVEHDDPVGERERLPGRA